MGLVCLTESAKENEDEKGMSCKDVGTGYLQESCKYSMCLKLCIRVFKSHTHSFIRTYIAEGVGPEPEEGEETFPCHFLGASHANMPLHASGSFQTTQTTMQRDERKRCLSYSTFNNIHDSSSAVFILFQFASLHMYRNLPVTSNVVSYTMTTQGFIFSTFYSSPCIPLHPSYEKG